MRWVAAFIALLCAFLYAAGGFKVLGMFALALVTAIAAERAIDALVRWWRRT